MNYDVCSVSHDVHSVSFDVCIKWLHQLCWLPRDAPLCSQPFIVTFTLQYSFVDCTTFKCCEVLCSAVKCSPIQCYWYKVVQFREVECGVGVKCSVFSVKCSVWCWCQVCSVHCVVKC